MRALRLFSMMGLLLLRFSLDLLGAGDDEGEDAGLLVVVMVVWATAGCTASVGVAAPVGMVALTPVTMITITYKLITQNS